MISVPLVRQKPGRVPLRFVVYCEHAMSETLTQVVTEPRKEIGSQHSRRVRRTGRVPAVVYGHKEEVLHVTVAADDMWRVIRQGSRVIDVKAGGKTEKCLVREIQWDVFGKEMHHVDFARVSADERIHVTVPIQLRGTAPGLSQGGVLNFHLHEVHIECLTTAMPENIRVNVGELNLGQAIHIKELVLPEGVVVKGDPDEVVVAVIAKQEEKEAPLVGEGAVEPEVLTARKPTEAEKE